MMAKITLCAAILCVSGCSVAPIHEPQNVTVSSVITEVERTLEKVKQKNPGIKWSSVELSLETVAKKGATTSIEFWVVSAESSVTNAVTQTISYKLAPKQAVAPARVLEPFSEQLSDAIIRADADVRNAIQKSDVLRSEQSSVSIKFAVEASTTGAAKVELVPVKLGAKGTLGKTVAHTIKISF